MNWLSRKLGFDDGRRLVLTPVPSLGIELHSREWLARARDGEPLPIILVAGLGVSSRYWVPFARRLAGRRAVLAPDLPGFGRSPIVPGTPWPAGPSPREQADQLLAWMNTRGIDRAVLCGHSVGCQIVADFAARFPERVERIILAAPTYERGKRNVRQQLPRLIAGGLFEIPWLDLLLVLEYGSAGLPRVVQQGVRSVADPIEASLARLTMPTLILSGEYDPVVPATWVRQVAKDTANARGYVEIGAAGHAIQFSAADVTADVVEQFLDGQFDPASPPADGEEIVPKLNARRLGPLSAPPQPISTIAHGLLGAALAGAALAVITSSRCSRRTRRTLASAAAINATTTFFTDSEFGTVRKLPMMTHATLDFAVGANLLIAAGTLLRKDRKGRRAAAILGASQVAVALLTYAPTGPATWRSARSIR